MTRKIKGKTIKTSVNPIDLSYYTIEDIISGFDYDLTKIDSEELLSYYYMAQVVKDTFGNLSNEFLLACGNIKETLADFERAFYGGWDFENKEEFERIQYNVGYIDDRIYQLAINYKKDVDYIYNVFAEWCDLYPDTLYQNEINFDITLDDTKKLNEMSITDVMIHLYLNISFSKTLYGKFVIIDNYGISETEYDKASYIIYGKKDINIKEINDYINSYELTIDVYENDDLVDSYIEILPWDYDDKMIDDVIKNIMMEV